jgi:hypothetical protein
MICPVPYCRHCQSRIAKAPFALRATAGWRSLSLWRSERVLDVLGKRIDHRAFVVALVFQEEPAADECVDLAPVKFDGKTAKAGPTSRPATTHSACGGFPCNNGLCRYIVY